MSTFSMVPVAELKPHPQNNYFFDDMTGEKWDEFIESIKKQGIIIPLLVTQGTVIVAGHQRLKAAIELGMEEVPVNVKDYDNDDTILCDLLDSNIRQRGNIASSGTKLGRIIREIERLSGVYPGNHIKCNNMAETSPLAKSQENNGSSPEWQELMSIVKGAAANTKGYRPDTDDHEESSSPLGNLNGTKSQQEIIDMLGVKKDTYFRAKQITELIPELQEMEINGEITTSVAARILTRLSIDEQVKLFESLPKSVKLSQKEVQEHISALAKEKDDELILRNEEIETLNENLDETLTTLEEANKEKEKLRHRAVEAEAKLAKADRDVAGEYIAAKHALELEVRKQYEASQKKEEQIKTLNKNIKSMKEEIENLREQGGGKVNDVKTARLEQRVAECEAEKEELLNKVHDLTFKVPDAVELMRVMEMTRAIVNVYLDSSSTLEAMRNTQELDCQPLYGQN